MNVAPISPNVIAESSSFNAVITIDEAAAADPVVTVGGQQMSKMGSSGLVYTYQYNTNGTEAEGGQNIVIAVDYSSGGTGSHVEPDAVVFDFSAPEVSIGTPSPDEVKSGQKFTVVVTVTDDYSPVGTVTATVGGKAMALQGSSGSNYTFEYTTDGTETEGGQDIVVTAADDLLHSDDTPANDAVVFDFSPPDVTIGDPSVDQAKVGTLIEVVVTVTDTYTSVGTVTATLAGEDMTQSGPPVDDEYTFTYSPDGSEGEGAKHVVVTAADSLGNSDDTPKNDAVTFDFTKPSISLGTPSDAVVKDGDVVSLDATVTDTRTGVAAVTGKLGLQDFTVTGPSGNVWTLSRQVEDGVDAIGLADIQVKALDGAGNEQTEPLADAVTIDFPPPAISLVSISDTEVKHGDTLVVKVGVTDNLTGVVSVTGKLGLQDFTVTGPVGNEWTLTRMIQDDEDVEGLTDIEVKALDGAGNERTLPLHDAVTIDFTEPTITLGPLTGAMVKHNGTVTLKVTVTDSLTGVASVTGKLGLQDFTVTGPVGNEWTLTRQVLDGTDLEGVTDIEVKAVDGVGNEGTEPLADAVTIDFTAPTIALGTLTGAVVKDGDTVILPVTVTDNLTGVASVTGKLGLQDFTVTGPSGNVWTLTRLIQNGEDVEGVTDIEVKAVDSAGNEATKPSNNAVTIDYTEPTGQIVVETPPQAPDSIPGPEPLNRYNPASTLFIAVRVQGQPIDEAQSRLRVEFSPTDYGAPDTSTVFDEALTGVVHTVGSDYFAGEGSPVEKRDFSVSGCYTVTANLKDTAGNDATPPVTDRFRLHFPVFTMRQGYEGKSYNSPDILMWSDDTFQAHYAPPGYPVEHGTEQWQIISNETNHIGLRIRNTGMVAGDCKYRIFCVPGAVFTNVGTWKLITLGDSAPVETGITPPGTPGGDHEGYRVTAGTLYDSGHAEWPDWTPPEANPEQTLHTCVCGIIHGSQDPLILRDVANQPVVINDTTFDSEALFRSDVMGALQSYPGTGAGYWNAVHGSEKISNINFRIKVVAAETGGGGGGEGGGSGKKSKAMEELPFPKEPFIPVDLPDEWKPLGPGGEFHYTPWLHDKILGFTPKEAQLHPRSALQNPGYFLDRHLLLTRGLRNGKHNELELERRRFPRAARVFCRLPQRVLSRELAARIGRLRPGQSPWKGTRLADDKVFHKLFPRARTDRERWIPLEILSKRVVLGGLALTERPVWIDVGWAVDARELRPKTAYVLPVRQRIDGREAGSFDFHLRAYHPYDVPVVGDRRTHRAYRRSNGVVSKIPAGALELFDSLSAARVAGYKLDPRDFGGGHRPELPDWLKKRLYEALGRKLPVLGRMDRLLARAAADAPENPWLDALKTHPAVVEGDGPQPPDPAIRRLLRERG